MENKKDIMDFALANYELEQKISTLSGLLYYIEDHAGLSEFTLQELYRLAKEIAAIKKKRDKAAKKFNFPEKALEITKAFLEVEES